MCAALPHNNNAAKCTKYNAQAIHHQYGFPTFFLTLAPDADNHYTIQVLSQEFIDVNYRVETMTIEALFEKSKLRTKLCLKYPGLCAIFFEMTLQTVIHEVLGWDLEKRNKVHKGLFARIDAFSCSIEEQG
jgi:hypothetical protein